MQGVYCKPLLAANFLFYSSIRYFRFVCVSKCPHGEYYAETLGKRHCTVLSLISDLSALVSAHLVNIVLKLLDKDTVL